MEGDACNATTAQVEYRHMMGLRQFGAMVSVGMLIVTAGIAPIGCDRRATEDAPQTQPAPRMRAAPKPIITTAEGWMARRERRRPIPPLPEEITRAFVISIRNEITKTTVARVKRHIALCKRKGAELVIFDLDTPGGLMDSSRAIWEMINRELKDTYTVAYVNQRASGSGTLISLACTEIVMAPQARIGDAFPVVIQNGQPLPSTNSDMAKIASYMRSEARMLALCNGYNPLLCEAMVSLNRDIWRVRDRRTREIRVVDPNMGNWTELTTRGPNALTRDDTKTKPVWDILGTFERKSDVSVLTFTADEAIKWGLASHVFDDMDALTRHYNVSVKPTVLPAE